ncbi:receptor-like protein 53 [Juglans regia]|uniref:Receptor-like protein 53 n=1 Tax=Juglans regia TaxID=51240 RepID=A0A6P9F1Y8_JUGRE|nr:receptor-like protein 53 [Juglans regia]
MRISFCSSLLVLMGICSLLLQYSISVASGQHFGDQQSSMLQFKDSLKFDTDRSTKLAHWNPSVDCCLWEGVSCDKGLVIGLDLSNESISDSCSLQTLDLDGNQLQGELPKSLTKCAAQLEVLDIGNNQIQDAFPCYLKNIHTLRVLILRSNQFYGPINCLDANATWSMLQILDLASNEFVGKFPIHYFPNWKAMIETENKTQSQLKHLQYEVLPFGVYYQNMVTVTTKSLQLELVKILTIFTSLDFSSNNFDEPIPGELGEFTALYTLNLSHNAFTGKIPQALGKLSHLESLDLSSNKLTGEIPLQLADGLIFLSTLNLSFNQLVGRIPQIKQFTTLPENSFKGNIGLCGSPLKEKCTESVPSSPTSEESHSNSGNAIDWNFLSAELGFVSGFGILVGPLIFWKRWRIFYYNCLDDIFFKMCPRLYIRIENRGRRARRNRGRQPQRNQGRRR